MTDIPDAGRPPEGAFRLVTRLIVDAVAISAFTIVVTALFLGAVAAADIAWRGMDLFRADVGGLQDFFFGLDAETRLQIAFAGGALLYLAIIIAILLVARLRRRGRWCDYIAWSPFNFEWLYLVIAALGIGWGMAAGSAIEAFYPESKNWVALPHGPIGVPLAFVLIVVLGPLCEEFIFRGWLFTALRPRLGFAITLVVTAVLFAAAHWEKTHLYALAVFPVGLLLGYARERSGGIKVTFAFHALYNFAGWILAAFAGK